LTLNYLPKTKIRGPALERQSREEGKGVKIQLLERQWETVLLSSDFLK